MAKLLHYRQVTTAVYDDDTQQVVSDLLLTPYSEDTTPPEQPLPIAASVLVDGLAVRSEAFTRGGEDTVQIRLPEGTNIFIDRLDDETPQESKYEWGVNVLDINQTRIGDYVAIRNKDTGTQFLDLSEALNPPKATLYPIVEKTYGNRTFQNIQIDGNNSRQQIGANFTFGLWMVDGNGAVIDADLKANGVTLGLTFEELNKFNKPHWTAPNDEEPYYGHVLRVRVNNKRYGIQQAILNGLTFMKWIKDKYTSNDGIPYIRVLFCFTDTFGRYPNLYFGDEQSYHDQPLDKTGNRYWNDEVWRRNLLPFAQAFIEAMMPYADYILGWQTGNEFALNAPQNGGANLQSIQDYIGGQKELALTFSLACDRKHHIMTGQRTGHDIYQEVMSSQDFYNQLFKDSELTSVNFHPYCLKPPISELSPSRVFAEWDYMQADIANAKRLELPIIADEMGTWFEGYAFGQPQRDEVLKYALQYLQWTQGVWCCMVWNQMLRADIDRGYGDSARGFSSVKKDQNGQPIAVSSTAGCVKVAHDHAKANYERG